MYVYVYIYIHVYIYSSFLRGVNRGPDSKVDVKLAMSLDNIASARANASLARSRGSADKSACGPPAVPL